MDEKLKADAIAMLKSYLEISEGDKYIIGNLMEACEFVHDDAIKVPIAALFLWVVVGWRP